MADEETPTPIDDTPAQNAPVTVSVMSLKYHTLNGEEHPKDTVYDVDASQVDNLVAQGMVSRIE